MAKNLFDRYIWLVDTINRAGKISFYEINRRWMRSHLSEGENLPLRTFHNHRTKIEELFDINIECNNFNEYYIENKEDMQKQSLRSWLLNTFAVNNLISESRDLKNRILLEKIPSGQHFLTTIIEAMRDSKRLKFDYQPFWLDKILNMEIEPYCLKIFKQRWYIIGKNVSINEIRRYSLDRILNIATTETVFKMPNDFDAERHFENAFGIVVSPKIKPCTVKIKAFGDTRKYLNTLPLHSSQQEEESTAEYSIFTYYIAPTDDFVQELLTFADGVEVLSPSELRNQIATKIQRMKNLYRKLS